MNILVRDNFTALLKDDSTIDTLSATYFNNCFWISLNASEDMIRVFPFP